jgi:hypothetical protein
MFHSSQYIPSRRSVAYFVVGDNVEVPKRTLGPGEGSQVELSVPIHFDFTDFRLENARAADDGMSSRA